MRYGWPKTLTGQFNAATGDWRAYTRTPGFNDVFDARNTTIGKIPGPGDPGGPGIPGGGGGGGNPGGNGGFVVTADLGIEAVFIDGQGGYHLENIWGAIEGHVGQYFSVSIPDLYLLDNNRLLVPNSILYSSVDLNIYLHDIPSFQLGDIFAIVNGANTSLPGMLFSSAPFAFDPQNGFTGTPFTGTGYTLSEHALTVPEPDSLALLFLGFLSLCAVRQWRREHRG